MACRKFKSVNWQETECNFQNTKMLSPLFNLTFKICALCLAIELTTIFVRSRFPLIMNSVVQESQKLACVSWINKKQEMTSLLQLENRPDQDEHGLTVMITGQKQGTAKSIYIL